MSDGNPHGTLYTIEWLNKYTSPPGGAPIVLAEVFTLQRQPPAEFEQIPFSLGGGYGKCTRHVAPPSRQLPQSTLAKVRRKRLARRLTVRVPMFADFFMQQEIEKKPDYYNGITDAKIKQAQDEVLLREWRAYNDYLTRIDQVIIYADEPPECKERSQQLRAEMEAIRHKGRDTHNRTDFCCLVGDERVILRVILTSGAKMKHPEFSKVQLSTARGRL